MVPPKLEIAPGAPYREIRGGCGRFPLGGSCMLTRIFTMLKIKGIMFGWVGVYFGFRFAEGCGFQCNFVTDMFWKA